MIFKRKAYELAMLSLSMVGDSSGESSGDEYGSNNPRPRGIRGPTVRRRRRPVRSIMYELGMYTRRYYRMSESSFWLLHEILKPAIVERVYSKKKRSENCYRMGPNGRIDSSMRLSMALRYFAGGDPLDIALVHGVGHSDVFRSVWFVVDAVNATFKLGFPKSHAEQYRLARLFKEKSDVDIDCCLATIDGILIWIQKPNKAECEKAKCGPKKFHCGRKKKFGLNMQGASDGRRRFLDVSIGHPGSTSDYLAFLTSELHHQIEEEDLLAPGLCLFGDNAYVSNKYMVTPFKNAGSGPKDAFNFFQSQLRINVECAFGMLVHRWGILRKAMPSNITIAKTCALVVCLCKLHNFCIDELEGVPAIPSQDVLSLELDGAVPIQTEAEHGMGIHVPQLHGGGEHDEDCDRYVRRQIQRNDRTPPEQLPQERLLHHVTQLGAVRPRPRGWKE